MKMIVYCKKKYNLAEVGKPYKFVYRSNDKSTDTRDIIGAVCINEIWTFIQKSKLEKYFCTEKEYRKLKLEKLENGHIL